MSLYGAFKDLITTWEAEGVEYALCDGLAMPDLVIADGDLEDVFESRANFSFGGQRLSVVSREGLIQMKKLRGSGRDMDDIRHLEQPDD